LALVIPGATAKIEMAYLEDDSMETIVWGVVKDGLIVPNSPVPEGAHVQIRVVGTGPEVPAELQAEFEGWDRVSAEALDLVERMAQEMEAHEKR
jgi:hypothetical protein